MLESSDVAERIRPYGTGFGSIAQQTICNATMNDPHISPKETNIGNSTDNTVKLKSYQVYCGEMPLSLQEHVYVVTLKQSWAS